MARFLYSWTLRLLLPLVLLRLAWRGLRASAYWHGWGQRLGLGPSLDRVPTLWVHAVSVGEVQAALPLLRAMREREPALRLLVTTTTPTGAARAHGLTHDDPRLVQRFLPYDLPGAVRRFLRRTRPCMLVIMETELWPNLIHCSRRAGIPVILANARLSAASARGYARIAPLTRGMLGEVSWIAAQYRSDARRFRALGADPARITVTGNLKADVRAPASSHEQAAALRYAWGMDRPVWVAGSTHRGEEEIVLRAFAKVRERLREALLVLVPRHPERFAQVARLCRRRGWVTALRSEQRVGTPATEVLVGDSMGELLAFYAAADVAFVGGSLVPAGGHNPLEPATLEVPVVMGPYTEHFADISVALLAAGGARRIGGSEELASAVAEWLGDAGLRHAAGEAAARVAARHRGALERLVECIEHNWGSLPGGSD